MDNATIIQQTQDWIASIVVGLNLCPFAGRVFRENQIRYQVSPATTPQMLLADLTQELQFLTSQPRDKVETTLLIHPQTLQDFLDYNDFLDDVEKRIKALRLRGVIQVASFHPAYQFAETEPDAVENYTNRSPYPMLHLLREESISELEVTDEELLEISDRNIALLREMGISRIQQRLGRLPKGPD